MPRTARKRAESNIYHVMLRGSNRQQIFCDDEDYQVFHDVLQRVKQISGMELHAYCLMGNHVHLLIRETGEPLETIFRRIGAAFVYWYNMKYDRVGHLFQDRYRSEPVESDEYYLTVLRYILQNPVKAGLCHWPEEYAWSSAEEYLNGYSGITDTRFARLLLEESELRTFLKEPNEASCLDVEESSAKHVTDTEAEHMILAVFGTMTPTPGPAKSRAAFNESVQKLLQAGISIRQLSRLTGLTKKVVENSK